MTGSVQVTADLSNWWKDPFYNVYNGLIYNDTKGRWKDGTAIHTSDIVNTDEYNDCFIVTTRNSVYRLYKCDKREDTDEGTRKTSV